MTGIPVFGRGNLGVGGACGGCSNAQDAHAEGIVLETVRFHGRNFGLGTQRTGPFRYRGRRRERIPEQPCSSRIRHQDEKNASAISMRILQTPW